MSTSPRPRALLEQEWPALRTAVNEVFRSEAGDLLSECPLLFDAANRENLRVVVEPGEAADRLVAHAGFVLRDAWVLRRRIRVACVGAVFTSPRERGKGLASQVLEDVLQRAGGAADLVVISGDRGLYRRHGFESTPPLVGFGLTPGGEDAGARGRAADYQAREASAADLKSMAALYDAEDVHFVRPPEDWSRLWAAGRLVDAPARFWLFERAGRTVAYVAVQQPDSRPGGATPRQRRILELAGDREAIFQGAPAVADEVLVPPYDAATVDRYQREGCVRHERPFPVTAKAPREALPVTPWYGLNYV